MAPSEIPSPSTLTVTHGDVTYSPEQVRAMRDEFQRFVLEYEFGMREVETKLAILRDEFQHTHAYNPIEHVTCECWWCLAVIVLRSMASMKVAVRGYD